MSSVFIRDAGEQAPQAISRGKSAELANSAIKWSAVFAGFFVSLLIYFALGCLALMMGSDVVARNLEAGKVFQGLTLGASFMTGISAMIALAVGSFVSGRVAGIISTRIGRVQGLVIAALFFTLMLTQLGLALIGVGGVLSNAVSGIAPSAMNLRVIEDAIGDLSFNIPAQDVAKGVAARLIEGDDESAITYLANQSGIDGDKARTRYLSLKSRFVEVGRNAAVATAHALRLTGLVLFFTVVLGSILSMWAGGAGAKYTIQYPISRMDEKAMSVSSLFGLTAVFFLSVLLIGQFGSVNAFAQDGKGQKVALLQEQTKPFLGVQLGFVNPDDNFSSAFGHGIQFGYHPYWPHTLGFELSNYVTDRTQQDKKESINRVNALVNWNYRIGDELTLVRNFFVGGAIGAVFDTNGPFKGTHVGLAPTIGFDVPVAEGEHSLFSVGLASKYLFVSGPSPDVFSADAVVKYWF